MLEQGVVKPCGQYVMGFLQRGTWLIWALVFWCCADGLEQSAPKTSLEVMMPKGDTDAIVSRLAGHLVADPATLLEEEVNQIIDHAMEHSWDLHYLEPGILYAMDTVGKGELPQWGEYVSVHYTGSNLAGRVFDSSRKRGEPFQFYVGNVIPAWNELLQRKFAVGTKGVCLIPSMLAYGKEGFTTLVAPGEHLMFDIELLAILPDPQ
ncbi:MAG: FKBP-type peptidyl-prolyl cis-trans isomerase [Saprospiraceae bacterium]|nr:FKBP-type peptidyl-prolyl cis-trans isomerase [Saprospiraceae bacterium]